MIPRRLLTALALFLPAALAPSAAAQTAPQAAPPTPGAPAPGKPAVTAQEEKARELFVAGKFDEALRQLQEAVKANPKLAPARVQLATLFFMAKQGSLARQNLETAAAEDPKHPDVYLLNASFAFGEGRLTDAVLSCQTALQLAADPRWDPEQRKRFVREARIGLASCFEGRRDFASARDVLAAVLAEEPKNGIARTRQGITLFMTGKPEEAYADFQTAYRDDPAMELPELQMAGLYQSQSAPEKSEEWLKRAIAAHGASAKPHRSYAVWLLDGGKLDEAQLYIDSAAKLEPANKDTVGLQAVALRSRKNYAAAEPLFEGMLRDSPGNTFAAWNLALTLAESGDKGKGVKAIELAENEVRKNPKSPEGLAVLAWCYYKSGNLDGAEKTILGSIQAGPLTRDAAYFYARIQNDKQRYEEALGALRQNSTAKGAHIYRAEAAALLAEVEKKVPPPKK